MYIRLQHRLASIMKKSNIDWEKIRENRIPEYDWKTGTPEEFQETFVKKPHPVVLRGFLTGTELAEEYTFDKMIDNSFLYQKTDRN